MKAEKPLKVLLWAPLGAGDHYSGPGTSAFHLYEFVHRTQRDVVVDLVHSFPAQAVCDVYRRQVCLSDLGRPTAWPDPRYVMQATRWLQAHGGDYDVIHALGGHWYTFFPVTLARPVTAPVVLKVTGPGSGLITPQGWKRRAVWALAGAPHLKKRLDAVIALNALADQRLRNAGIPEARIARVPNGVNVDAFAPATEQEQKALRSSLGLVDCLTFVVVGGLVARKNQAMVVEALGSLQRAGLDVQLLLVGPERETGYASVVAEQIRRLPIPDRVVLVGHQHDVGSYLNASDVFVLASTSEGMSNALLEAMACGLPVIVGDNPGNRELVPDATTGLVVVPALEAVVSAMRQLAESADRRRALGTRARQRILAQYSHAAVWATHRALFERLRHVCTRCRKPATLARTLLP